MVAKRLLLPRSSIGIHYSASKGNMGLGSPQITTWLNTKHLYCRIQVLSLCGNIIGCGLFLGFDIDISLD